MEYCICNGFGASCEAFAVEGSLTSLSLSRIVVFSSITGDMVSEINSQLPDEIRVLGCVRVTKHFNAWKLCDKRQYEYCLPLWLLDKSKDPRGKLIFSHFLQHSMTVYFSASIAARKKTK